MRSLASRFVPRTAHSVCMRRQASCAVSPEKLRARNCIAAGTLGPFKTLTRIQQPLQLRQLASKSTNDAEPPPPAAGAAGAASGLEPSTRQLRIVALRAAIPMIGFGFMDNIVMIQAGEAIDLSLGVAFGLSTLTAAGFGQCVSDVAGYTCGGAVDAMVTKMNLPSHGLSMEQLGMKSARLHNTFGGSVGVVFGCLLGMTSLLFMDTDRADRMKKAKELTSIFETVMDKGNRVVHAERCTLWMHDRKTKELWSRHATGTMKEIRVSDNSGVVGSCVQSGEVVNIRDAYEDARFNPAIDKETGYRTRSIIAVPVKDDEGHVIGAIQMINKKNEDGTDGVFDSNDVKMLKMLSYHVSVFTRIVTGEDIRAL